MILTNPFSSVCKYHILFIFEVSSRTLTIGREKRRKKEKGRNETRKTNLLRFFNLFLHFSGGNHWEEEKWSYDAHLPGILNTAILA